MNAKLTTESGMVVIPESQLHPMFREFKRLSGILTDLANMLDEKHVSINGELDHLTSEELEDMKIETAVARERLETFAKELRHYS